MKTNVILVLNSLRKPDFKIKFKSQMTPKSKNIIFLELFFNFLVNYLLDLIVLRFSKVVLVDQIELYSLKY